MKLIKLKSTAKICATAALVALLAAAGTGTAAALRADTTSEDTTFDDVGEDHIFSTQISVLVDAGVLTESDAPDGSFNSGEPVKMVDMAIWMGNLAEKYDVDTKSIDFVTETFSEEESTTRGSAAGILSRFFDLRRPGDTHTFDDVTRPRLADSVSSLQEAGITYGCGDGTNYCGTRPFTRGHAAAFMGRFVETYGASKARTTTPSSGLYAGWSAEWADSQRYVSTRTPGSSSVPADSCSGGMHLHTLSNWVGVDGYPSCQNDHGGKPACSPTPGVNLRWFSHVGDSHVPGVVPACPPPKLAMSHSDMRPVVTAGLAPAFVLQADDEATHPSVYDVVLSPYEQPAEIKAICEAPRKRRTVREPISKMPTCTVPAVAGVDYADEAWSSVEIAPGATVVFTIVDTEGKVPRPTGEFGTLPKQFQATITDVENPAVSVTTLITLNPPGVGSG